MRDAILSVSVLFTHLVAALSGSLQTQGVPAVCDPESTATFSEAEVSAVSLLQSGLHMQKPLVGNNCVPYCSLSETPDGYRSDTTPDEYAVDIASLPDFSNDELIDRSNKTMMNSFKTYGVYGLSYNESFKRPDGMYQLVNRDGKCSLATPVLIPGPNYIKDDFSTLVYSPEPLYSEFLFGKCPHLIATLSRQRLRNLGPNPTFVALPDTLKAHFPAGRWLAMQSNAGFLLVLDDEFETVAATRVHLKGTEGLTYTQDWNHIGNMSGGTGQILGDPRLFTKNDGSLVVSFVPYFLSLVDQTSAPDGGEAVTGSASPWYFSEMFGPLHVSTRRTKKGVQLTAWTSRKELRTLHACPEEDKKLGFDNAFNNTPLRNSALMQPPGGDLYVVDWVFPPKAGKLDLESPVSKEDKLGFSRHPRSRLGGDGLFCGGACLRYSEPQQQSSSLFERVTAEPRGSPLMIWLNETRQFLGISHFSRGAADPLVSDASRNKWAEWGHHYTFAFFTWSEGPPFRMTSISTEFCFASDWERNDCEVVQFVTGLQRDGDKLVIMYGSLDVYGYVASVNLTNVLASLQPVT